ncbi:MAG TPA: amidohydrolase family protein [Gemmatimonadaceae bacterium]|nr:amidohydrolase family protein [Gemmatimonadaceae bacterium]
MRPLVVVAVLASALQAQRGPRPRPAPIVIDDVTLIDGTGAAPRAHARIIVRDGRIASIGPASGAMPDSVRVIDGRGRYAIPGLIDGHVHLAGRSWQDRVDQLHRTLLGGVTSVYELAGDTRISGDLARAVMTHEIQGPSIYYTALLAGPPFFVDPRAIGISQGFRVGEAPWAHAVAADSDLARIIAAAHGTGAGTIKLYASLDSATVTRAIAEAHRQGMRVVAHATTFPAKPSDLVAAGVDMLAHTPYLVWQGSARTGDWTKRAAGDFLGVPPNSPVIETLLESMRDRHVALNPTLWVFAEAQKPDSVSRVRTPWMNAVTKRAQDLGVTIVAGTDNMFDARRDSLPTLHRELELEVQAGLTPMQALVSATSASARVIGVDSARGTIAVGRDADIVLLDANPLEDIRNTRRIHAVIKDGVLVTRDSARSAGGDLAPPDTGAADPRAVQPERPTVATHAYTVAPGYLEIETGIERDQGPSTSFPTEFKIGLASHAQLSVFAPAVARSGTRIGVGDVAAGVKWRLFDQAPVLGRFAVLPSIKLPSGSSIAGRGTGTTDASLLLISSHDLGAVTMDLNAGYTWRSGSGANAPVHASLWTASFGGPIREQLGWTAECFGYPATHGPAGQRGVVALLAGPTVLARNSLAFDTGMIWPLTGPQPRALYAGLVYNVGRL